MKKLIVLVMMLSFVFITSTGGSHRTYKQTKVDSLNKSLSDLNSSLEKLERILDED